MSDTQLTRTKLDELHDDGQTVMRHWLLTGPEGAVQVTFTKLPDFPGHFRDEKMFPGGWVGTEFGYHALTPPRTDDDTDRPCDHVPGGRCYFSGSAIPAIDLVAEWSAADRDDEVIWRAAELSYRTTFLDGQEERQP